MPMYYTCEYCGSNLDPGERCDCQKEKQTTVTHKNAVLTMLPYIKHEKALNLKTGGVQKCQTY